MNSLKAKWALERNQIRKREMPPNIDQIEALAIQNAASTMTKEEALSQQNKTKKDKKPPYITLNRIAWAVGICVVLYLIYKKFFR